VVISKNEAEMRKHTGSFDFIIDAVSADHDLNAYLDRLFADLLRRIVGDVQATEPPQAYRRMAMQSLVLARLAGFLAGHVALPEDPLRKLVEAMMLGYAEAEAPKHADHHHHHDHADPHHH